MFRIFGKKKVDGGTHPVLSFDKVVDKTQLKMDTKKIWACVSLSRSQFEDHYIGLIRNIAVYMQDKIAFSVAVSKGAEALQETMIIRLPYDRPREQGAKFEQLWKFAMFSCHLTREAARINRHWYDRTGKKQLFLDLSANGMRFMDAETKSGMMLVCNLNQIIPSSSAEWLMQDEGRCANEIGKAAGGQLCFIDLKRAGTEEKSALVTEEDLLSKKIPNIEKEIVSGSNDNTVESGSTGAVPALMQTEISDNANGKEKNGAVKNGRTSGKEQPSVKASNRETTAKNQATTGNTKNTKKRRTKKAADMTKVLQASLFEEPKVQGDSHIATDIGIARTDEQSTPVKSENVSLTNKGNSQEFSMDEFVGWMDINADWDITPCGRKAFPYQSSIQRYINSGRCVLPIHKIAKILTNSGYERILVNDKQLMMVPEEGTHV